MSRHFRLRSASRTHAGLVRAQNEDSLMTRDDAGVWAVADGMGGHVNGQWASSEIVAELGAAALVGEFDADVTQIAAAIQSANHRIFSAGEQRSQSMGSTIVAAKHMHAAPDLMIRPNVAIFRTLDFYQASAILRTADAVKSEVTETLGKLLAV